MVCCKKEPEAEGIVVPGIYNLSYLDSLGYKSVGMEIIPIDSLLPGERGPMVPLWWNIPLHDAKIEFNKHFRNYVQEVIEEESKRHYIEDEVEEIETDFEWGNLVRGAERDLDTIINGIRYVFTTEL